MGNWYPSQPALTQTVQAGLQKGQKQPAVGARYLARSWKSCWNQHEVLAIAGILTAEKERGWDFSVSHFMELPSAPRQMWVEKGEVLKSLRKAPGFFFMSVNDRGTEMCSSEWTAKKTQTTKMQTFSIKKKKKKKGLKCCTCSFPQRWCLHCGKPEDLHTNISRFHTKPRTLSS